MTDFLSDEQRQALTCVLDTLIPPSPDGRMPGAGALGIGSTLETALASQPDLWQAVEPGLAAFLERVGSEGLDAFAARPVAERAALLEELSEGQPAFVPSLVFPTYTSYYQDVRVLAGLGMPGRAPYPKGYEMAPTDTSLLDSVRGRTGLYREC